MPTENYERLIAQQDQEMEQVSAKANALLRKGMMPGEAFNSMCMGPPIDVHSLSSSVMMWNYCDSASGTCAFWVVFKDGVVDYFGLAQTSWLQDVYRAGLSAERVGDLEKKADSVIRPGQTQEDVMAALGAPFLIKRLYTNIEIWSYYQSDAGDSGFWIVFKNKLVDFWGVAQIGDLEERYSE